MNNKKITILFILIATISLIGIVGFTIAYFTSTTDFENELHTGFYETQAVEEFESPENWLPGDTTEKTLIITNTGDVDVVARVCLTEEWESANGDTLPNEQNGESVAILDLVDNYDWTKFGSCYLFRYVLEPGDETSSFIDGVTFNPNTPSDVICTTSGSTKTCSSSGDGYDNATYTLTFTVETFQVNMINNVLAPYLYYGASGNGFETAQEAIVGSDYGPYCIKNKVNYEISNTEILILPSQTEQYLTLVLTPELVADNSEMTAGVYSFRWGGSTYDEERHHYNSDSIYYDSNVTLAQTAFGSGNCTISNESTSIYCQANGLSVSIDAWGSVAGYIGNSSGCGIDTPGNSLCGRF